MAARLCTLAALLLFGLAFLFIPPRWDHEARAEWTRCKKLETMAVSNGATAPNPRCDEVIRRANFAFPIGAAGVALLIIGGGLRRRRLRLEQGA